MLEPLPGLLSTTTGWPSALPNASLMARATESAAPPGANPITRRIGLVGYAAVCAPAWQAKAPRATARTRLEVFIVRLPLESQARAGRSFRHGPRIPFAPWQASAAGNR